MKKILIIGAGFLQQFVIQKAKKLGYYVLALDGNPNAIGFRYADLFAVIDITDKEKCLRFAMNNQIDGVITAATDYGVLTVSYIAQKMGLPGLDFDVATIVRNKYKVRNCLHNNHVDDFDQTFEVDTDTNIMSLSKKLSYPVFVKPCDGSGSRAACKVNSEHELPLAITAAINSSTTHHAEIETFIDGKEYGAESFVYNGKIHVFAIMQKWMTNPPYYAELGHAIPNDLPFEIEKKAVECIKNAIRALGINYGSVNMDIIISKSGKVFIVDIGARMGGNLIGSNIIPLGTGIDYMSIIIKSAVKDSVSFKPFTQKKAVATRLLAFKNGTVMNMPDMDSIEKKYNCKIYHHIKTGERVYEYHTNLDGLGYIVATATSKIDAERNASSALKEMEEIIFGVE